MIATAFHIAVILILVPLFIYLLILGALYVATAAVYAWEYCLKYLLLIVVAPVLLVIILLGGIGFLLFGIIPAALLAFAAMCRENYRAIP